MKRRSPTSSARPAHPAVVHGPGRLGQDGGGHGVPLADDLVVAGRPGAASARLEQEAARRLDLGRAGQRRPERAGEDRGALPVAGLGDPVPVEGRADELGVAGQGLAHLGGGEGGVAALDPVGVGVLGGAQPAALAREVREHVAEGLGHHLAVVGAPGDLPGVQVAPGPAAPGRSASSRSAGPASGGRSSSGRSPRPGGRRCRRRPWRRGWWWPWPGRRGRRRGGGAGTARRASGGGTWGPARSRPTRGRTARPARPRRARARPSGSGHRASSPGGRAAASRSARSSSPAAACNEGVGLRLDLVAPGRPGVGQRGQQPPERRHARPVGRREVGAAEEGPAVGGAEDRHRPPARSAHGHHRRHVDGVDVGPLLAVDLDRDEPAGEVVGHRRVLEALVGHHVAPVARGVADRDEDRLVLVAGPARRPRRPTGSQSTGLSACWRR